MTFSEYEHMKKIRNHVFSVPPGAERDKRLSEISEADSARLYDFDVGLISGRIREPKNRIKESEGSSMNNEKRIRSYQEFVKAWSRTSNYHRLVEFHRNFPEVYEDYMQRMEREKLKAKDPVGYLLKYGNSAKEV